MFSRSTFANFQKQKSVEHFTNNTQKNKSIEHFNMFGPFTKTDGNNYYLKATTLSNSESDKGNLINTNIQMKNIVDVVSSKDQNCSLTFVLGLQNLYLCYFANNKYNLKQIYPGTGDSEIPLVDVGCSGDGKRVYLFLASMEVLTAANTGSESDPVYNFVSVKNFS